MHAAVCQSAMRQVFGGCAQITAYRIIADGYRNLTAEVVCMRILRQFLSNWKSPLRFPECKSIRLRAKWRRFIYAPRRIYRHRGLSPLTNS